MKDKKEVPLLEKRWLHLGTEKSWEVIDYDDVLRAIKEFDRKMNLLECADMIRTSNGMKCPWTPEGVALMELVRSSFKELFGEGGSA